MESVNAEEDLVDYYGMQEGDEEEGGESGNRPSDDDIIGITRSSKTTATKPRKRYPKRKRVHKDEDYSPKKSSKLKRNPLPKKKSIKQAKQKSPRKQLIKSKPIKSKPMRVVKEMELPTVIPGPFRLHLTKRAPPNTSVPKAPSGIMMHYCDICNLRIYYVSADGWEKHLMKKHGIGVKDDDEKPPDSPEVMILSDEDESKPEPEVVDVEDDEEQETDELPRNQRKLDKCGTCNKGHCNKRCLYFKNRDVNPDELYHRKTFKCGTCFEMVLFDKRREHQCLYYMNRGYTVDDLEHNCTILQKVIRYATGRGLEQHLQRYHRKEKDNNAKVYLQDDGSLSVLQEEEEETKAGHSVVVTSSPAKGMTSTPTKVITSPAKVMTSPKSSELVLKVVLNDVTKTGAKRSTACVKQTPVQGHRTVKTKKNGKKSHKGASGGKNGRHQNVDVKNRLRKVIKAKTKNSNVASKLVAKASKHMNAVSKNATRQLLKTDTHRSRRVCFFCQARFANSSELKLHECYFTKFVSRVCKACIKWFNSFNSYKSHNCRKCDMKVKLEQGCWKVCRECNEFFDSLQEAFEHVTEEGPKCRQDKVKVSKPKTKPVVPKIEEPEPEMEFRRVSDGIRRPTNGINDRLETLLDQEVLLNSTGKSTGNVNNSVRVEYVYPIDVSLEDRKNNPDFREHWLLK